MKKAIIALVLFFYGMLLLTSLSNGAAQDPITYYFANETGEPVSLEFTIESKKGIYRRTVALAHGSSHINIIGCLAQIKINMPKDIPGAKTVFPVNPRFMCTRVRSTIIKLPNDAYDIQFNYE